MRSPLRVKNTVLAAAIGAMLAGCAVGPNFHTPEPPPTQSYTATPLPDQMVVSTGTGGGTQRFAPGQDLPGEWWSLYQSPALDRLIRQALADSPTLAAASATLRAAQENYRAQTGALLYPAVNGDVSGDAPEDQRRVDRRAGREFERVQSVQRVGQRVLHARRVRRDRSASSKPRSRWSTTRVTSCRRRTSR